MPMHKVRNWLIVKTF